MRWLVRRLVFAAILLSWDEAPTLGRRFAHARSAVTAMFPSRPVVGKTYQGFIKALLSWGSRPLEAVMVHLRIMLLGEAGAYARREGFLAFAVDGTRIECPRTKSNERAFGLSGKDGCGPQMWLTTLWHMGTGLPWAWKQGPARDAERNHLRDMLPLLPAGALLVADAGFVGYDLFKEILDSGRSCLIRVGGNVHLLKDLYVVQRYGADTVYLWPRDLRGQPPLVLRLIELRRGGKTVYLMTNLGAESLTPWQAGVLYEMRWGVEVFYRSLKETLDHRVLLSHGSEQAKAELGWAMVGLQLMGLMSVREMIARDVDPLEWSVAGTQELIQKTMKGEFRRRISEGGWKKRLASQTKDRYFRLHAKAPNEWPRRKESRPPRPPKITVATPAEVQRAQKLLARPPAA